MLELNTQSVFRRHCIWSNTEWHIFKPQTAKQLDSTVWYQNYMKLFDELKKKTACTICVHLLPKTSLSLFTLLTYVNRIKPGELWVQFCDNGAGYWTLLNPPSASALCLCPTTTRSGIQPFNVTLSIYKSLCYRLVHQVNLETKL